MSISLDSIQNGLKNFYVDLQTVVNPPELEGMAANLLPDAGNALQINRGISLGLRAMGTTLLVCSLVFLISGLIALSTLSILLSLFIVAPLSYDLIQMGSAIGKGLPKAQDGVVKEGWKYFKQTAQSALTETKNLFFEKQKDSCPFVIAIDNNKIHFNEDKLEEIISNTWLCGPIYHGVKKLTDNN